MIKLGKTARYVRESKGLTQRATAQKLGISPVHLSNIENGKANPSPGLLARYRELWNVDLYVLAWCLFGKVEDLPDSVKQPMRELAKAWEFELERTGVLQTSELHR